MERGTVEFLCTNYFERLTNFADIGIAIESVCDSILREQLLSAISKEEIHVLIMKCFCEPVEY